MPVCVLHVSEDRTWQANEVTLSALPVDPCLTVVTAAAAAIAAPPVSEHSLQYEYPSVADPVRLALRVHGPTPSPDGSSSSTRLSPYPSSCRLSSDKEKIEDYKMARDE
jgi:hypothetical protein